MEINFTGRGLFIFSDPGGAKAVLAMAHSLKSKLDQIKVISDRKYDFTKGFEVEVILPSGTIKQELDNFNPTFIFTGTSYSSNIELEYIVCAQERGIFTVSFIDHWTSFLKRFENKTRIIYPDKILVIDDRARRLAISEGLPEEKIIVFNNPYYHYLKGWKPNLSKEKFCKTIGIQDISKPLIVFAPDPLSNAGGTLKFGFDEIEATEEISRFLESKAYNIHFLFKPHPNQDMSKIKHFSKHVQFLDSEVDSNTLMFYSDIIIGFFSNFLIEASVLQKKILRFHPRSPIFDPIADLEIGQVVDTEHLILQLEELSAK